MVSKILYPPYDSEEWLLYSLHFLHVTVLLDNSCIQGTMALSVLQQNLILLPSESRSIG